MTLYENLILEMKNNPKNVLFKWLILTLILCFIAIIISYFITIQSSAKFVNQQLINICLDTNLTGTIKINCDLVRASVYNVQDNLFLLNESR